MKRNIILLLTLSIISTLLFTGCGSGGGATGSDTMNVTVIEVDNTPPTFTSNTEYTSPENKRYITSNIHAQDISEISYTITGGEDSSKFSIDSYDATLIFKEFPDYDIVDDSDGDNIYQATIMATDVQGNNASQDITVSLSNIDENIPKTYQIVSNLPNGTTTLDLGSTSKDVYLLFTNTDTSTNSTPTVSHNKYIDEQSKSVYIPQTKTLARPKILHAPNYVHEFNSKLSTLLSKAATNQSQAKTIAVPKRSEDIVSQSKTFYLDADGTQTTTATARKVISNITTNLGSKTLNIWVSDDSFDSGSGCSKSQCVTQTMVDQLAVTFLNTGLNNDIYDWVTNIYEEEWGSAAQDKYSNLITADDEITILLTDIDEDNSPDGGVIGFFWSKDNLDKATTSGSNERIMFYVDAVIFANGEGTWDIDDFWPKEMVSTLAHEFQHMIHFYQKTILLADDNTDRWINEMLSESVEDLIATKIQHIGPRGVDWQDGSAGATRNDKGRYPLFNQYNTLSLTYWPSYGGRLQDYSKVNAFGAYLIRNYGGPQVLHDIMHNTYTDKQAIEDAISQTAQGSGKTLDDLIHEWGISVLLSDHTDTQRNQYSYNTDDFTVNLKNQTIYKMGSIDFFNYSSQPNIETTMDSIEPKGNYYYQVATNRTGDVNITINKDSNVIVSAVIKE